MLERIKKQSFKKLLIMFYNVFRMLLLRIRCGKNSEISMVQNIHPSCEIAVINGGDLTFKHSIFTRRNVSFRVEGGDLRVGTSFFNQGCSITCMDQITIGDDCLFGPNVVIVDHDHDYKYLNNERGANYLTAPVIIEDNVWIGANVTILRGTDIGSGAVIGAGTVIKGIIPANSVVTAKRDLSIKMIKTEK